jgi:glucose-1-phosphate cytidylyltransferase
VSRTIEGALHPPRRQRVLAAIERGDPRYDSREYRRILWIASRICEATCEYHCGGRCVRSSETGKPKVMKVVLFCGGLGTRLREHSETIPKPLVSIGYRPIVWHLMRYYASFGHTEFILCLGYRGDAIREYFLHYNEAMSNDFTLSDGGKRIELHKSDLDDWRITFVDTGLHSNIGERLLSVRERLKDETMFLANYSDGLSDIPLDTMIAKFEQSEAVATFAAVSAASSFHSVRVGKDDYVSEVVSIRDSDLLINGGFFVLRREIFDFLKAGEELVEAPFQRLIAARKLLAYKHTGFWRAMDTLKDKIAFDRTYAAGDLPWKRRP